MIDHIFFKMNFRKIYSGAISESLSKLTERVWGFKREGVRKEHGFVNGKYVDSYDLSLFRKDWIKNGDRRKKIKNLVSNRSKSNLGLACLDISEKEKKSNRINF